MNDIRSFVQQTHPNNVLLHVLASFVGKFCCLQMVRMRMNDIEFCCRQTHPNNVLLHVIASFAGTGNVPLCVAYCRI